MPSDTEPHPKAGQYQFGDWACGLVTKAPKWLSNCRVWREAKVDQGFKESEPRRLVSKRLVRKTSH